ncbi:unnamed protein product [Urochloa humidicola]
MSPSFCSIDPKYRKVSFLATTCPSRPPRTSHSRQIHLTSPSVREDGLPPIVLEGSSSSSPPPPQGASRPRATRRRKLRSSVWKDFDPIYNGNLIVQAKCHHCLDIFAADRENGRSACHRHLEVCKERIRMTQMVESIRKESLSPDAMALKNWKFNQEVSREAMVNFIVLQELPFSLVEHEPFKKFIATLNPWFDIVSRTAVVGDVVSSFENRKLGLKEIIKESDSRVALTADFWTSKQNLGYLCITCHFINKEWKLQKRIISFGFVASPHDGLTMFNALLKSLKDWNLDKKVFSITLDNAKNNNKMVGFLSQNLKDRQLFKGNADMLHMRCAAHVLNLIVQDGFKLIEGSTTHIRDSIKYIRTGLARKQLFEEILVQLGLSSQKRPCLDVPTCWNSTYLMLLSAKEYRTAFETLDTQDNCYMDLPSPDEWKMADLLCEIFKPFYDATTTVSGSLYPTSHLYFHVLWKVKERIEKEASNENQSIAAMAIKMKQKFQKYWDLSYLQICVPVVLDPRFKFNFVAFRLDANFGDKGPTYTTKVKSTINDMFSAYSSCTLDFSSNCEQQSNVQTTNEDNPWADWEQHLATQRSAVKTELEVYLQDDVFPLQKNFDILQWWMMHSTKYPILSCMARDVFAAPATTVPSESAFSTGGRVISDYRSRLTSKNVEALICLQDWLKAEGYTNFKMAEDIDDNEDQYYNEQI